MSHRVRWIAAVFAAGAALAPGANAGFDRGSWIVDRGGYRICTPRTVFPRGVSFITICARVSKAHWQPIWSAQAILTTAYKGAALPARVGLVDFSHIQLELRHWSPRGGAILISGYVQYVATSEHPAYRAYVGCKRCADGRSTWWTEDGGAHWWTSKYPKKDCLEARSGWTLKPRWPQYRAWACSLL